MVMEQISLDKAKEIAKKKGLKPGRVKGTNGIQFTKGSNARLRSSPGKTLRRLSARGDSQYTSPAAG